MGANTAPVQTPADLLTISEVLMALRISRDRYYKLIAEGELAPVHVGRAVRIRRTDIDDFLARGGTNGKRRRRRGGGAR